MQAGRDSLSQQLPVVTEAGRSNTLRYSIRSPAGGLLERRSFPLRMRRYKSSGDKNKFICPNDFSIPYIRAQRPLYRAA